MNGLQCLNPFQTNALCDFLRDLVPFGRFKKREHPWRSVLVVKLQGSVWN